MPLSLLPSLKWVCASLGVCHITSTALAHVVLRHVCMWKEVPRLYAVMLGENLREDTVRVWGVCTGQSRCTVSSVILKLNQAGFSSSVRVMESCHVHGHYESVFIGSAFQQHVMVKLRESQARCMRDDLHCVGNELAGKRLADSD